MSDTTKAPNGDELRVEEVEKLKEGFDVKLTWWAIDPKEQTIIVTEIPKKEYGEMDPDEQAKETIDRPAKNIGGEKAKVVTTKKTAKKTTKKDENDKTQKTTTTKKPTTPKKGEGR